MTKDQLYPCHNGPQDLRCDRNGPGGFMGHTCEPKQQRCYCTRFKGGHQKTIRCGFGHDDSLSFAQLRAANMARLPQFKNKRGQPAHSEPDGSDWSPAQWLQAVLGELGEYANLRKKFERGDITAEEFQHEAADELADVQTYLDILAFRLGVDLGEATISKFNRISERVKCDVRL